VVLFHFWFNGQQSVESAGRQPTSQPAVSGSCWMDEETREDSIRYDTILHQFGSKQEKDTIRYETKRYGRKFVGVI